MINKITILPFLCMVMWTSCKEDTPEIRAACEIDRSGNYLLKWETFPPMKGVVKIFESNNPDSFNSYSPIAEQDINIGFKSVFAMNNLKRSYFQLLFNKKYSVVTAERIISAEGVFNLRDIGGYYNNEKKQTRWARLYRSSTLAQATPKDIQILNDLQIKTVIDLRAEREKQLFPSKFKASQEFNFPLRSTSLNLFFDKILSEEMKKGDVIILLQDIHTFLLENNSDYFSKMFDILLDESNYPVLIFCSLGKDRSGIAAALVLAALEINNDLIAQDYLLSNDNIDFHSLVKEVDTFTPEVQETFTALLSAHEETINYGFEKIIKDYGSIDHYLEKELKLTPKKRQKLKDLLLYQKID